MGFASYICKFITFSAKAFFIILLISYALNLLPKTVTFTEYLPSRPLELKGNLALNNLMNDAERLFDGEIKGPEGFAILNQELYTSLHGGYLAKIKNNGIMPVVKFGQDCDYWWEEEKCGRPLGLTATEDGHLIVADAYYGIWKFNPTSNKKTVLVEKNTEIEGKKVKIFNAVAVGKDGSIYWTHSSSDFELSDGLYTMLADGSGRLLKYDPVTKKNTVLLDKIHFANGVALSQNEDYVLVAETARGRIRRVYLKGGQKMENDVFMDGLPGMPDNIRPNGKGGFYISLVAARDEDNPALNDYIAQIPLARKILARLLVLGQQYVHFLNSLYPNQYMQMLGHIIGHFEMLTPFLPTRATFLEVNEKGEVVKSYHGTDGSIEALSDVIPFNGYMYLGSPYNTYLGRIRLSKLGLEDTEKRLN